MRRFDHQTEVYLANAVGCRVRRNMAKTYDEARRFKYIGKAYHLRAREHARVTTWPSIGALEACELSEAVTRELLRRYQVVDTLKLVLPPLARKAPKIRIKSVTLTFKP